MSTSYFCSEGRVIYGIQRNPIQGQKDKAQQKNCTPDTKMLLFKSTYYLDASSCSLAVCRSASQYSLVHKKHKNRYRSQMT